MIASRRGFLAGLLTALGLRPRTGRSAHPLDVLYDRLVASWPDRAEINPVTWRFEGPTLASIHEGQGAFEAMHDAYFDLVYAALEAAGYPDARPDDLSLVRWGCPVAVVRTPARIFAILPQSCDCPDVNNPELNYEIVAIDLGGLA